MMSKEGKSWISKNWLIGVLIAVIGYFGGMQLTKLTQIEKEIVEIKLQVLSLQKDVDTIRRDSITGEKVTEMIYQIVSQQLRYFELKYHGAEARISGGTTR